MEKKIKSSTGLPAQVSDGSLGQIKFAVVHELGLQVIFNGESEIQRLNSNLTIVARAQGSEGAFVDGGAENAPTFTLREGRDISTSTSETDSKWRFCPNQH